MTSNRVIKNPFENPIAGILTTLHQMKENILNPDEPEYRKNALNTKTVNGFTIDTVVGSDAGLWETGVQYRSARWIIVEQYENERAAKIGHEKWAAAINKNPKLELKDIFL